MLLKYILVLLATSNFSIGLAHANPYLAKPGEVPLRLRSATGAVSGGFMHLYAALENGLFNKYGISFEHIHIQASAPVLYRLVDLGVPFIYSSVHANGRMLRKRPDMAQRVVAAFAEAVHFVEKNPDKAKAAVAKVMRTFDAEALQSSYDVYAKEIVDRRMIIPEKAVADTIEQTRLAGGVVRRKSDDLFDNSFAIHLEKSGFLKELWGSELGAPAR